MITTTNGNMKKKAKFSGLPGGAVGVGGREWPNCHNQLGGHTYIYSKVNYMWVNS